MGDGGNRNFNLFSHHLLVKQGKPLTYSYDALKEGILELYLSVKIRSDEEIDNYNEELFKEEKRGLRDIDGFTLIDYIKSSIEVLMNMKVEEQDEMENPGLFDGSLGYLNGSINMHERSGVRSPAQKGKRRKQGTHEIENKQIDIRVDDKVAGGGTSHNKVPKKEDADLNAAVGVPEMDSHEGDR